MWGGATRNLDIPVNTRGRPIGGLMLGQRRRRWPNTKPTFGGCLVLTGCPSAAMQQICI